MYNPLNIKTMHKISRIIVKEMAMLSNEEMAMITGGNDGTGSTTTQDYPACGPGRVGMPCSYYENNTKYDGTCNFSGFYDQHTSIERYYCE